MLITAGNSLLYAGLELFLPGSFPFRFPIFQTRFSNYPLFPTSILPSKKGLVLSKFLLFQFFRMAFQSFKNGFQFFKIVHVSQRMLKTGTGGSAWIGTCACVYNSTQFILKKLWYMNDRPIKVKLIQNEEW